MSTIRQRTIPSSSPPVDSAQQLSAALKQIKESASAKGITQTDFSKCLGSAAEKNNITFDLKKPSKVEKNIKKTSGRSCGSRVCLCLKVMWLVYLSVMALFLLVALYPPASFYAHKLVHVSLYKVTRPIRLGLVTAVPLLKSVGLDLFSTDCLIENPLLSDNESCPCLHVKTITELQNNETLITIAEGILELPTENVYVVRNAVDTSNVTLDSFQDFKQTYHREPKTCLEMTSDSEEGLKLIFELFDEHLMSQYLNASEPWAFTWEECPNEQRPQSFWSLLPQPTYLPPNTELSSLTLFTLSNQWANTGHHETSFPGSNVVAVLVIIGEVRFMVDPSNIVCYDSCTSFRKQFVLQAGDVLLFDQTYWNYMSVTWSKYAMTSTIAVTKTK